jgi:hypothetical protein
MRRRRVATTMEMARAIIMLAAGATLLFAIEVAIVIWAVSDWPELKE